MAFHSVRRLCFHNFSLFRHFVFLSLANKKKVLHRLGLIIEGFFSGGRHFDVFFFNFHLFFSIMGLSSILAFFCFGVHRTGSLSSFKQIVLCSCRCWNLIRESHIIDKNCAIKFVRFHHYCLKYCIWQKVAVTTVACKFAHFPSNLLTSW